MEIFGVGGAEFILILLIMLIVAGPKRMIHWSYQLGVYAGKLRHIWSQVAEGLEQEMRNEGLDIKIPRDITNKAQLNQFIRQQARPLSDSVRQNLSSGHRCCTQCAADCSWICKGIGQCHRHCIGKCNCLLCYCTVFEG